jgi:uncharacterized repeat protein (TIGR03803 family)
VVLAESFILTLVTFRRIFATCFMGEWHMRTKKLYFGLIIALAVSVAIVLLAGTRAVAQTETVLYSFGGELDANGSAPRAGLVRDAAGNLYGTTLYGGTYSFEGIIGWGTVFELSPTAGGGWTVTVLHSFNQDGTDGVQPESNLVLDAAGHLYGTTYGGGAHDFGTVFELSSMAGGGWTETILHSFNNPGDGYTPVAGLVLDSAGNLYGTTVEGGRYSGGTVFELSPASGGVWTEKILHHFGSSSTDGGGPLTGVTVDAAGNLYGTTSYGGANGVGAVYEISRTTGTEKVLHSFSNTGKEGYSPAGGLILDAKGNLYGTTPVGGATQHCGVQRCPPPYGTVFELTPSTGGIWSLKVLHTFVNNGKDGYRSEAGLVFDTAGNLYGTTSAGGPNGYGTVFELTPTVSGTWAETVLYSWGNTSSDDAPLAGLILDATGNLYGTTPGDSSGNGAVFEVTP